VSAVSMMIDWAESELDGTHDKPIVQPCLPPGPDHSFTADLLPAALRRFFPNVAEDTFHDLTIGQLDTMSRYFNAISAGLLTDYAGRRGEVFEERMSPKFWCRLMDDLSEDPKFINHLCMSWWTCFCHIGRRDLRTGKPNRRRQPAVVDAPDDDQTLVAG